MPDSVQTVSDEDENLVERLVNTATSNLIMNHTNKSGGGRSRTGVREPSAFGSTCLAESLNLIPCCPKRRRNAGDESVKL